MKDRKGTYREAKVSNFTHIGKMQTPLGSGKLYMYNIIPGASI